jgi:hypothetical protein
VFWQQIKKIAKSDIKVVPVLALAFYLTFVPHMSYPYALHIDEWVHIAHSNELMQSGTVFYSDPFSGQGSSGIVGVLELGYHLPLAVFQKFSNISWMDIARFFPSINFVITVLLVYIFASRLGYGLEAAFFTSLIPSTVGILGPALMVPVAMALTFVPFMLFLVFYMRSPWSYLVVCLTLCFLVILHATSAVLMIIILTPVIILGVKSELKHSLFTFISLSAPFLLTLPWTFDSISSELKVLLEPKPMPLYHDFLKVIQDYGYIPVIACLVATFIITLKWERKNLSLALSLLALLAMLSLFYTLHYGIDALYFRGLLFTMLVMSIVAGFGLSELRKFTLHLFDSVSMAKVRFLRYSGAFLWLVVIGATLFTVVPNREAIPFYHMIDRTDYEAFVWIKNNVPAADQKAMLDPWKGTAFTAVTGKYVYTKIHVTAYNGDLAVYEILKNGCKDTDFLRKNGISIVYTRVDDFNTGETFDYTVSNPDLIELRKDIYILKDKTVR